MTIHTIIKNARERIELLEGRCDKAHAEYSTILWRGRSSGKTDDELQRDKAFCKRLHKPLEKSRKMEREMRVLRYMIYEYEKEY